jgi:hypothetical protein
MQRLGAPALPRGKGWKIAVECRSRKCVHHYWREFHKLNYIVYIRKMGGLSAKIPYVLYCKKPAGEITDQELKGLIKRIAVP